LRHYDWRVSRGLLIVAVLAAALSVAACGERSEPVGAAAELYPLTVTTEDRPLTIPAPAKRIVVLDGGAEAILEAIGAGDRVVGSSVKVEDVSGLRPDLVVAPSGTDEQTLSQADAAGAPVYVTPDRSITEIERAITQLGLIVAEPAAARRRVRDIERRRQRVTRQLRGTRPATVFVDRGGFTSASDSSLIGDVIREARGRNVAGDVPDGLNLTVKQLLARDPDVYVTVAGAGATLKQLRKGPRTKRLQAVRRGRVVTIDGRLLTPGPSIGIALEVLARALHPNAVR
jgi:ABC-type Fe3+-hydroxamate transport system substrate-binding protein